LDDWFTAANLNSALARPGHQESFVAVSFPTCLQIIASILERPQIEQILTHLGLHQ